MSRHPWLFAALILIGTGASAQTPPPHATPPQPAAEPSHDMGAGADTDDRMTVPVTVGNAGPYDFVVDTGSERTVISRELAQTLALTAGRDVNVTSIADTQRVPTVMIPNIRFARRTVDDIQAPALAQAHLGAAGLLGVDSLQNQRVVFDFRNRSLSFGRVSRAMEQWEDGTIVVRARSRLGRLIVTDASVDGQRVHVVIDTGSAVTIGNPALRLALERRGRIDPPRVIQLTAVTGTRFEIHATRARSIQIGSGGIRDLPIAFADAQIFRELGLGDRPAILMGMDALQLFARVAVDFANRRVQFQPPEGARLRPGLGMHAR